VILQSELPWLPEQIPSRSFRNVPHHPGVPPNELLGLQKPVQSSIRPCIVRVLLPGRIARILPSRYPALTK